MLYVNWSAIYTKNIEKNYDNVFLINKVREIKKNIIFFTFEARIIKTIFHCSV